MGFPKMIYKNEKCPVVQHKNEVGYPHKVVDSESELEPGWGDHPESAKEEKADKKADASKEDKKESKKEETTEDAAPEKEEITFKGKRK